MKRCSRCKEEKSRTLFYKNRATKDGLEHICKVCRSIEVKPHKREYYLKHREQVILKSKEWGKKNKTRRRENNRKWAERNPEKAMKSKLEYKERFPTATKASNLKKYGLTVEQFSQMLIEQNNVCAICKKEQSIKRDGYADRNLYVDHDHKTGKIRGLLCHRCNFGIGQLQDSVVILMEAINYLQKYEERI